MRTISSTIVLALLTASGYPTLVLASAWTVERVSGTAWAVSPSADPVVLKANMTIAEGDTIATSPNGRLRIERAGDVITLSPGTSLMVVPGADSSSATRIVQRDGTAAIEVAPRQAATFSVETPYLAAVVKGTAFTVAVEDRKATVSVSHGLVEVRDFQSGETASVGAGQSAGVSPGVSGLQVAGVNAPGVVSGRPTQAPVAAIGQPVVSPVQRQGILSGLAAAFSAPTGVAAPSADAQSPAASPASDTGQSDLSPAGPSAAASGASESARSPSGEVSANPGSAFDGGLQGATPEAPSLGGIAGPVGGVVEQVGGPVGGVVDTGGGLIGGIVGGVGGVVEQVGGGIVGGGSGGIVGGGVRAGGSIVGGVVEAGAGLIGGIVGGAVGTGGGLIDGGVKTGGGLVGGVVETGGGLIGGVIGGIGGAGRTPGVGGIGGIGGALGGALGGAFGGNGSGPSGFNDHGN